MLFIETRRFVLMLMWPWGGLSRMCDYDDDKRLGWTRDGEAGAPGCETRFAFGRTLWAFSWKPKPHGLAA